MELAEVEPVAAEPAEGVDEVEEPELPADDDAGGAGVNDPLPDEELPELPELWERWAG